MRVLLLDEGFISGTVTARGLRRAGCLVDVIAATGGRGRCVTRDGTWRLAPRVGDPRLPDVITAAIRRSTYDVVYPVTEPLQWLVWDARPVWEPLVFPRVPEPHRAARRDKRVMSALVAAAGVAIPRQLPAGSDAEVRAAVRALGVPLVVKGVRGRGGQCDAHLRDARRRAGRRAGTVGARRPGRSRRRTWTVRRTWRAGCSTAAGPSASSPARRPCSTRRAWARPRS
jgi:nucleotide-binding universal stress UspA family protein